MKITSTALLLASALVGAHAANSYSSVLSGAQTVKDNFCKDTVKTLVLCAAEKDYVTGGDTWQGNSQCVTPAQPTFSNCKGSTILYENSVSSNVAGGVMGYPAYVAAATLTKSLQFQGLVAIPSHDNKLRGVSCSICSKFTRKMLECALPVTVPVATDPDDAFLEAVDACLTTAWDRVLYDMCVASGETSAIQADASGKVSYLLVSPQLTFYNTDELCPSVEAKAKANGAVLARVGKAHVDPYAPPTP